jgi:hypothetical protein
MAGAQVPGCAWRSRQRLHTGGEGVAGGNQDAGEDPAGVGPCYDAVDHRFLIVRGRAGLFGRWRRVLVAVDAGWAGLTWEELCGAGGGF